MKKERGITLIALIISIIIIIILSAITIRGALGDNGLIQMATGGVEKMKISEYQEELTAIGVGLAEQKVFKGLEGTEYLNKFKEKVDQSELFKNKKSANIIDGEEGKNEKKLRIVTKEGYIFDVTEKDIKYVGKIGDEGFEPMPDLAEESIKITLSSDTKEGEGGWTRGPVTATIEVNSKTGEDLSGFTIQYTKDEDPIKGEWLDYNKNDKPTMTTNGTITARLRNKIGETSKTATAKVTNIDTVKPDTPTITSAISGVKDGKATQSITVEVTTKDGTPNGTTQKEEQSGIYKLLISTDGNSWKDVLVSSSDNDNSKPVTTTYELTVENDGEYTVRIKAVDKADNESEVATSTPVKVDTTPPSTPRITFTNLIEIQTELNSTLVLRGDYETPLYVSKWMKLSTNKKYLVSFDYKCVSGTNKFAVDLYPDELPQYCPVATTTLQHLDIIFASQQPAMENCLLRFFDDIHEDSESDITISNMKFYEIGTDNSNTSYSSDILVTITPGQDTGPGATGLKETKYNVAGPQPTSGTILNGQTNALVTLTKDGQYTITATTIDIAGNVSTVATKQVTKSEPKEIYTVELQVKEEETTGDTIPIKVSKVSNAADGQESNSKFTYMYFIDEETTGVPDNQEHTFKGLDRSKMYKLTCRVEDEAGNFGFGSITVISFSVGESYYRAYAGQSWLDWGNSGFLKPRPVNDAEFEKMILQSFPVDAVGPADYSSDKPLINFVDGGVQWYLGIGVYNEDAGLHLRHCFSESRLGSGKPQLHIHPLSIPMGMVNSELFNS